MKKIKLVFHETIKVNLILDNSININNILNLYYNRMFSEHRTKEILLEISVYFIPSNTASVIFDESKNKFYISGPIDNFQEGTAIYLIVDYIAECLQTSYLQTTLIHSASIYSNKDNKSYLIMGEKGSGKTTLAYSMCYNYDFKIIGNDLTRIGINPKGELCTYEGSSWFTFRETAIKANSELSKFSKLFTSNSILNNASWNNKIKLSAKELSLESYSQEAVIKKIIDIRIDPFQEKTSIKKWNDLQSTLLLHERIGRHISGQTMPFQDDNGKYLGSLPQINYMSSDKLREKIIFKMLDMNVYQTNSPSISDLSKVFISDTFN
ncbi:hypothetical protein EVU91_13195 [Macrococcoides bohemicum]|uniref:hypothetical protein n=1 Tax=Macrococcoides bohemicum TaxID=1903056 RepID=UPI00105A4CE7|nr:hypothetical protein [Macrococcus bohemicus]TDL33464.1 hypothetical protein EVU91_13195 [Macrococcus bohemicus]